MGLNLQGMASGSNRGPRGQWSGIQHGDLTVPHALGCMPQPTRPDSGRQTTQFELSPVPWPITFRCIACGSLTMIATPHPQSGRVPYELPKTLPWVLSARWPGHRSDHGRPRLLRRTRGHPAGGHFRWLGSSRSTPACRRAESAGRDGGTAGLFELAGGLDRYLGARIGDLAQRCRDLDGYPLAHGTGDTHAHLTHIVGGEVSPLRSQPSIMHVDLDAFFASVEQRDKPSLAGKPVVVAGTGPRAVVATASYEARRLGVHSAMAASVARRLAGPGAAFLGVRMAAYKQASAAVMAVLRARYPLVEQVSIDEAYIDLAAGAGPGLVLDVATVAAAASQLQAAVAAATGGLSMSVGAGSSKLIAKIASDLRKPAGVTVVAPGTEQATLWPLEVSRLPGVGPATAARLRTSGVHTIGDLAAVNPADLAALLGQAAAAWLHEGAHGRDDRPVIAGRDTKSVSAEETFDVDLSDPAEMAQEVAHLAARVAARLAAGGLFGRTVTLKLRRADFTTITRAATTAQPSAGIAGAALQLLAQVGAVGGVRLLGVSVSALSGFSQPDLFWAPAPAGGHAGPAGPAPAAAGD